MILDVSKALKARGEEFPFAHEETIAPQEVLGDTLTFDSPVSLTGIYAMTEDTLRLKGRIKTVVHATCANCLAPCAYEVDIPFEEYAAYLQGGRAGAPAEESDEMEDRLSFSGSGIDLEHLTLTLVLLSLPLRFLCREDCQGYLDMQGAEDTDNACREAIDEAHPFAALKKLLT